MRNLPHANLDRFEGLDWAEVAKEVATRSERDCYIQWMHHQHPLCDNSEWTKEEVSGVYLPSFSCSPEVLFLFVPIPLSLLLFVFPLRFMPFVALSFLHALPSYLFIVTLSLKCSPCALSLFFHLSIFPSLSGCTFRSCQCYGALLGFGDSQVGH